MRAYNVRNDNDGGLQNFPYDLDNVLEIRGSLEAFAISALNFQCRLQLTSVLACLSPGRQWLMYLIYFKGAKGTYNLHLQMYSCTDQHLYIASCSGRMGGGTLRNAKGWKAITRGSQDINPHFIRGCPLEINSPLSLPSILATLLFPCKIADWV